MPTPIKRHASLQPVSREHHDGLLVSWKIRKGLSAGIAPERIKKYLDWFWEKQLLKHFIFEEKYMFTILNNQHKYIKRALKEHDELKQLFNSSENLLENLKAIEKKLIAHIRFEERILFQEIETIATEKEMKRIERAHAKILTEKWHDEFWITN